jgi:hypothetical protein
VQLYEQAQALLQGLTQNITEEELNIAKNILKVRVLSGLERPHHRLTETLKNLKVIDGIKP